MTKLSCLLYAFAGSLCLVYPAIAGGPLTTPALQGNLGNIALCQVVNAGSTPVTVSYEMVNGNDGTVYFNCGSGTIPPGLAIACGAGVADAFVQLYCRFTTANEKQIRANIALYKSGDLLGTAAAQ